MIGADVPLSCTVLGPDGMAGYWLQVHRARTSAVITQSSQPAGTHSENNELAWLPMRHAVRSLHPGEKVLVFHTGREEAMNEATSYVSLVPAAIATQPTTGWNKEQAKHLVAIYGILPLPPSASSSPSGQEACVVVALSQGGRKSPRDVGLFLRRIARLGWTRQELLDPLARHGMREMTGGRVGGVAGGRVIEKWLEQPGHVGARAREGARTGTGAGAQGQSTRYRPHMRVGIPGVLPIGDESLEEEQEGSLDGASHAGAGAGADGDGLLMTPALLRRGLALSRSQLRRGIGSMLRKGKAVKVSGGVSMAASRVRRTEALPGLPGLGQLPTSVEGRAAGAGAIVGNEASMALLTPDAGRGAAQARAAGRADAARELAIEAYLGSDRRQLRAARAARLLRGPSSSAPPGSRSGMSGASMSAMAEAGKRAEASARDALRAVQDGAIVRGLKRGVSKGQHAGAKSTRSKDGPSRVGGSNGNGNAGDFQWDEEEGPAPGLRPVDTGVASDPLSDEGDDEEWESNRGSRSGRVHNTPVGSRDEQGASAGRKGPASSFSRKQAVVGEVADGGDEKGLHQIVARMDLPVGRRGKAVRRLLEDDSLEVVGPAFEVGPGGRWSESPATMGRLNAGMAGAESTLGVSSEDYRGFQLAASQLPKKERKQLLRDAQSTHMATDGQADEEIEGLARRRRRTVAGVPEDRERGRRRRRMKRPQSAVQLLDEGDASGADHHASEQEGWTDRQ